MPARSGDLVKITYDLTDVDDQIEVGDALVTATGRVYAVRESRPGRKPGRFYLKCLVVDEVPEGVRTFDLQWNSRDKGAKSAYAAPTGETFELPRRGYLAGE